MPDRTKPEALPENPTSEKFSSVDEKDIEKRHQYQMFPIPDQEEAARVITELDV